MGKRILSLWALGIASVLFALAASAADNKKAGPQVVQPKPVQEAPAPQAAANGITQAMFNSGAVTCAPQINRISNFLTEGGQVGAFLFVPPKEVDRSLVSVSMEIQSTGTPLAYASASFSPGTVIGCGGLYEAITYWNGSCPNVAAQIFKDAKPAGALKQAITILEGSPSARIFLMPAGAGCVSIKKEVLM